ncbi:hypothetical protein ACFLR1_01840 [Bacteroidota bacterium]
MSEAVLEVLEILKYILPSGIVFLTAYHLVKKFLDDKRDMQIMKARAESKKNVLPTKLQAYERLILFLERIEPNNLVTRVHRSSMTAKVFQHELLKTVRSEFEHNLTQQLYVSNDVWNSVNASVQAVNQLINLSLKNVTENATGLELSNVLFEIVSKAGVSPTAAAIKELKTEARQLL